MRIEMISEHASPLAALGGADAGGQNVYVAELSAGLARLGHDVVVHTRRDSPELPERVRTAQGVTVEHVRAGPPTPIPKDELLPYMKQFGEWLVRRWASRRPDVVHAHFWMSGLAARQATRGLGLPFVQTFHALGRVKRRHQAGKDTSPPCRERVEEEIAEAADLVIATCSDEVRELAGMGDGPADTAIVPCGIDLDLFVHNGPIADRGRRPRILSIGRMVERKGIDTVIAALAGVPEAELIVAGGPAPRHQMADPEMRRLRSVATDAGVADRVRFVGPVAHEDTPALYRSADVVVSTPWYEPFGTVPLEAMACGVPLVVTRVGGHIDTVLDQHTGLFVPPRDSAAVARALGELLSDSTRRKRLGINGVRRVRARYGWDRLCREVEAAYERVLSRPPTPPEPTVGVRRA